MIASSIGRVRAGLRARGDRPPLPRCFAHIGLASAMAVGLTPAGAQMKRRDPRPLLTGASSGVTGSQHPLAGAIYKVLCDTRRKLRAALDANGYLDHDPAGCS
jgi:hypothetical protein